MKRNYKRGTQCLNCNQTISKAHDYCYNCGQKNNLNRYTVSNLIYDFLHNFVSYDSKLRTSIRGLIEQPGKVPKDFVNGKRIRYVNPFRLYFTFSIVIILFITSVVNYQETSDSEGILFITDSSFQLEEDNSPQNSNSFTEVYSKTFNYLKNNPKTTFEEAKLKLQIEDSLFNRLIFNKTKKLLHKTFSEILLSIISQLPITLLITIPIISLFFSLLYFNHHFNYAEHLTFLLYNTSFIFLALTSFFFIDFILEYLLLITIHKGFIMKTFVNLFNILFVIYIFKSMKFFYENSWRITIIKTSFLLSISFFIIFISILIMFSLSILIF